MDAFWLSVWSVAAAMLPPAVLVWFWDYLTQEKRDG